MTWHDIEWYDKQAWSRQQEKFNLSSEKSECQKMYAYFCPGFDATIILDVVSTITLYQDIQ